MWGKLSLWGALALLAVAPLGAQKSMLLHGTMTHVHREWIYEHGCGLLAQVLHRCDDTQAFVADITTADGEVRILFFRLGSGPHPMKGDTGLWTLHRDIVYPFLTCEQRGGMTSYCPAEVWWTLESDDDMKLDVTP
jgi:hypothetical protein